MRRFPGGVSAEARGAFNGFIFGAACLGLRVAAPHAAGRLRAGGGAGVPPLSVSVNSDSLVVPVTCEEIANSRGYGVGLSTTIELADGHYQELSDTPHS